MQSGAHIPEENHVLSVASVGGNRMAPFEHCVESITEVRNNLHPWNQFLMNLG